MHRGATFDPTGVYRYRLWREWDPALPTVAFIMLNPSTADATYDDPTIRRCIGFARSWGFGRLEVANLFAYRATRLADLRAAPDPVGPCNTEHLAAACAKAGLVIAAWGNGRLFVPADPPHLPDVPLATLGLTRLGEPRHPLYAPAVSSLVGLPPVCNAPRFKDLWHRPESIASAVPSGGHRRHHPCSPLPPAR